jgi:hypothetical protein
MTEPRLPIHQDPARLAKEPLVLPKDMDKLELDARLNRIAGYRNHFLRLGLSKHVMAEDKLKTMLARAGYSPNLSSKVFAAGGSESLTKG